MAVHYECVRCAACCRWPGEVKVRPEEITHLAAFLGLPEDDFIQRYTRLQFLRRGLALTEKANGECVFLDGRDCRVQPVKPRQCRDFPNVWNFSGFERECRAASRSRA